MEGQREGVVVTGRDTPTIGKVKGLFQLLTEIQILSEGEKKAGDYNPEMTAPLTTRASFLYEGFHTALISLIFTFFTLPFVVGVFENYFPAFGKYEHSTFERILLYLLSFSPGMTKILFIAVIISRVYLGKTTKAVVDWFLSTLIACILGLGIVGIFVYLTIHGYALSEVNLQKIYYWLLDEFRGNKTIALKIYKVLVGVKLSIFKAILYFAGYILVEVAVIGISYAFALWKTKRRKKLLRKYGIDIESP